MKDVLYNEIFEEMIKKYALENRDIENIDYSFDEKNSEYTVNKSVKNRQ